MKVCFHDCQANSTYHGNAFLLFTPVEVLLKEIELLAQKFAGHGKIRCVQCFLTPLYNVLRSLRGLDDQALAPLDTFMSNSDLLDLIERKENRVDIETQLLVEITHSFLMRNMGNVQRIVGMIKDNVNRGRLAFNHIIADFYVGLASCFFARQNREDNSHIEEAKNISEALKKLITHSKWNFEHRYLLLVSECHYTDGEIAKAIESYDLAIAAAKEHKFLQDEALGEHESKAICATLVNHKNITNFPHSQYQQLMNLLDTFTKNKATSRNQWICLNKLVVPIRSGEPSKRLILCLDR